MGKSNTVKNNNLKVVIGCYYPILRDAVSTILRVNKSVKILAETSNIQTLKRYIDIAEPKPNLVILDTQMLSLAMKKLFFFIKEKSPKTRVFLLIDGDFDSFNIGHTTYKKDKIKKFESLVKLDREINNLAKVFLTKRLPKLFVFPWLL